MWEALLVAVFSLFVYLCLKTDSPRSATTPTSHCAACCSAEDHAETRVLPSGWPSAEKSSQRSYHVLSPDGREPLSQPVDGSTSSTDESRADQPLDTSERVTRRDFLRDAPPHLTEASRVSKGKSKAKGTFCRPCSKPFGSEIALQQHRNDVHHLRETVSTAELQDHPLAEKLKCDVCEMNCESRLDWRRHRTHMHNWAVLCTKCLMTFGTAKDAVSHYQAWHGAPHFGPGEMDIFTNYIEVKFAPVNRPEVVQPKKPECGFCGTTFHESSELEEHLQDPFAHADRTDDHFPSLPSSNSRPESLGWGTESIADSSITDGTSSSDTVILTPNALQITPDAIQHGALSIPQSKRFESWKESVKFRPPPPGPPVTVVGGIEEQLPSFFFGSSGGDFTAFPTPPPEDLPEQGTSDEEITRPKLLPKSAPSRAPIAAWSTSPHAPKLPTAVAKQAASTPTYPDLAAIARRPKPKIETKGKGRPKNQEKKPPTPPLQPIFDDGWTITQPATTPVKGRGGKVIQEEWGTEAANQARWEAQKRYQMGSAGKEDPYGGW